MRKFLPIFILLFSFLLMGMKSPELPDGIKKQLHSNSEYKIKVIKNRNFEEIYKLAEKPDMAKILVLQNDASKMNVDIAKIVMNWVENGGTLWFYNSEMAHFFGMENANFTPGDNMVKKVDGEFGETKKFPGKAMVAVPYGSHPLLSGVTGALIFSLKLSDGTYSAVKSSSDVKAIMKPSLTSDVAVIAVREVGKGKVIFKPLLWLNRLDGARLQANLLEYSAGFPVPQLLPGTEKISDDMLVPNSEMEQLKKVDFIELKSGQNLFGKVQNEKFKFESADNSMTVETSKCKELTFGGAIDTLVLLKGKSYKGIFFEGADGILFKTPSGKVVKLQKSDLKKIIFNRDKGSMENE